MNADNNNPFSILLSDTRYKPTILDKLYEEKTNKKVLKENIEENIDPIKSIDHQEIDLKSSSFSSSTVTRINDESQIKVANSNFRENEDTIVVFDGKSDDSDNSQIELCVRQPSFVSLHGQIIPKGADSLSDLKPLIEKASVGKRLNHLQDIQDDDPQVRIIKILSEQNKERWETIGYEPPSDLIPLARARSQTNINKQQNKSSNNYVSTSLTKFYINDLDKINKARIDTIEENQTAEIITTSDQIPQRIAPTPMKRKRSGSSGMKLGEALSSKKMINLIIPEEKNVVHVPSIPYFIFTKQENKLFGRLGDIVTEKQGTPLYNTILTSLNPPRNAIPVVRVALRKYEKIALSNGWKEEADYLFRIYNNLPIVVKPKKTKRKTQKVTNYSLKLKRLKTINRDDIEIVHRMTEDFLSIKGHYWY